jgi:6-pyruvoyltetrahydropterin/6-carboxytetrahydropterin synthase
VTVKVHFEAAHRLHNPDRSEEWNRRVFGKCNNPLGPSHNYVLEVEVEGGRPGQQLPRRHEAAQKDSGPGHRRRRGPRHLNHDVDWLEGQPDRRELAAAFSAAWWAAAEGVRLAALTVRETERNRHWRPR